MEPKLLKDEEFQVISELQSEVQMLERMLANTKMRINTYVMSIKNDYFPDADPVKVDLENKTIEPVLSEAV